MYAVLLFPVLHQQINCCFILVLANNQNIIMELVAHGGTIFYTVYTHRHTDIHACMHANAKGTTHTHTHPIPHAYTHTHRGTHTRQGCSALSCRPSSSRWILFHCLRVSFLGAMRGGLCCGAQLAPRETRAGPRRQVAALQSRDLDLPSPSLRFSSFIALSPGI